jgi:hypothetical protein
MRVYLLLCNKKYGIIYEMVNFGLVMLALAKHYW